MRRISMGLLSAGLLLASGVPVAAQSGFALKGGLVFNSSDVQDGQSQLAFSDAAGYHLGAEFVLPLGVGVGLAGYTAGAAGDFQASQGSLVVLAEANYFFNLPILPVTPYFGVHTGLETFSMEEVQSELQPEVAFGDLGWQLGVRFQPMRKFGLDAQFRRVSGSLQGQQDASFETNQFLLGVTLF